MQFLKEGDEFLNKNDLVQASEKYYKAAEEAIKILSNKNNIKVLSKVKKFDRWRSEFLFEASLELSANYSIIKDIWKSAWILHVEGFHETRLTKEKVTFYGNIVKNLYNIIK
ncbi:PaREP1 family protein [Acidianus brierleyi]|uniref:PaREP1 family protein n=1 Tax=Acidianus brierleyi TaxID=41673 RepID=A0A2U9IGS7_9CREN|nr:PaREP1 family protein [Acidianus brierleyi]AWR95252.1 hypothetical protein DFR85_12240 [Acidianus brierleyi]